MTPGGAGAVRYLPAPAGAAHHLVLRHRQRGRRDIKDLHGRSDPAQRAGQVRAAPAAKARLNDPGLVRPGNHLQASARMALLPALWPARPRSPAARLCPRLRPARRAVLTRRLRGIRGVPARPPAQRRDLGPQRLDQRGLLRHHRPQFRVPGSQFLIRQLFRKRHPRTQP